MVYRDTKHNKTRIKTFPVAVSSHQRGNTADAVVAISNALIENNPHYLAPELIPPSQIEKMIKKLLDTQSSTAISNSSTGSASAMADYNNTTPSSHTNHDHKKSTTRHTNTNTNANDNNDDDDGAFFMPGQGKSEENLNDLTESEYQAKKAEMDVDFEQNRLRPGDAGYERDVRQEFAPAEEENDWDDSSDEDMYL